MICVAVVFVIAFVAGMTFLFRSDVSANNESVIRYETVQIEAGDTLWSIAREHYKQQNGDIRDYIEEIRECNNLATDTITEGHYLCIPVYTKGY
jgi:nucleoid-associated protein YgaU